MSTTEKETFAFSAVSADPFQFTTSIDKIMEGLRKQAWTVPEVRISDEKRQVSVNAIYVPINLVFQAVNDAYLLGAVENESFNVEQLGVIKDREFSNGYDAGRMDVIQKSNELHNQGSNIIPLNIEAHTIKVD